MKNYIDLVKHVLETGKEVPDRTGTGTLQTFGAKLEFDLSKGFPAVTSKKLAWKAVVSELLWFLKGSSNVYDLEELLHGTRGEKWTIWTPNYEKQGKEKGYQNGYAGRIYGVQWRDFDGVDQINDLIEGIRENPFSRRHVVSAWNPADLPTMILPPCHLMFIVVISPDNRLNLQFIMRSTDVLLGLPFNIASYALLANILCKLTGYEPGMLSFIGTDVHIYKDHIEQCKQQIEAQTYALPQLQMPDFEELEDVLFSKVEDYKLINYKHGEVIKAKMSA